MVQEDDQKIIPPLARIALIEKVRSDAGQIRKEVIGEAWKAARGDHSVSIVNIRGLVGLGKLRLKNSLIIWEAPQKAHAVWFIAYCANESGYIAFNKWIPRNYLPCPAAIRSDLLLKMKWRHGSEIGV